MNIILTFKTSFKVKHGISTGKQHEKSPAQKYEHLKYQVREEIE